MNSNKYAWETTIYGFIVGTSFLIATIITSILPHKRKNKMRKCVYIPAYVGLILYSYTGGLVFFGNLLNPELYFSRELSIYSTRNITWSLGNVCCYTLFFIRVIIAFEKSIYKIHNCTISMVFLLIGLYFISFSALWQIFFELDMPLLYVINQIITCILHLIIRVVILYIFVIRLKRCMGPELSKQILMEKETKFLNSIAKSTILWVAGSISTNIAIIYALIVFIAYDKHSIVGADDETVRLLYNITALIIKCNIHVII